jgi:nucleotide-binding universal stress UspA family protein
VRNAFAHLLPGETTGERHPNCFEGQAREVSGNVHSNFWTKFSRRPEESSESEKKNNLNGERPLAILVPIDFTTCSLRALACAFGMAQRENAQVTLLHAIYINLTPYGPANLSSIEQEMFSTALANISRIMAMAKRANIPVGYVIQKGKPCAVIEDYIQQNEVDLVILAPHRHQGLARFLSRKTSEEVIRRTNCPVLILNN